MRDLAIKVADAIGCLDEDRCARSREVNPKTPPCDECIQAGHRAITVVQSHLMKRLTAVLWSESEGGGIMDWTEEGRASLSDTYPHFDAVRQAHRDAFDQMIKDGMTLNTAINRLMNRYSLLDVSTWDERDD